MLISVVLFIKAALFDKRPQKIGLIAILLSLPLYLTFFADRLPFGDHVGQGIDGDPAAALSRRCRSLLTRSATPLENIETPTSTSFRTSARR